MSRQRFVLLAIAAVVAICAALALATRRNSSQETEGGVLLPTLAAELNSVTAVSLAKGGATPTTTLRKSAGGWTVAERADYPADVVKLRKLLTSLSTAKIVEVKTADPARYAVIGVEDPAKPGATSGAVTVVTPRTTYSVIVGNSVGEGNFVRRDGERQSYSVEPAITLETDPHSWIDARLIDVPVTKIQSVEFKPAGGAAYTVHRSTADGPFSLDGAPAGRKPADANVLAPSPTTFSGLTAEDVAAQGSIDFSQPFVVTVTLTDGDVLTLTGTVAGPKHWVQITSTKDSALNAKANGRAFEVASYRYDAIFKPLEQLLLPKESPAPKTAPAGAPRSPTRR